MNRIFSNTARARAIQTSFALAIGVLSLLPYAAFAQSPATPAAGLWEVKIQMKAGMMRRSPDLDQRCLTPEAAATFDQFFTGPPSSGAKDNPSCQLNDVQRGEGGSSWMAACVGPRGKMDGKGESTFTDASYKAQQTFKMGSRQMTMTTTAKRLGPCGAARADRP
ncbi:MAG: DUF3617 family protein [Pyrinomonadaceae bacterium]|nr:DUF3617 family protein [Phycisphaerales bacterium]